MKIKSVPGSMIMLFTLGTNQGFAASRLSNGRGDNNNTLKEKIAKMTPEQRQARVVQIKARVAEIKEIDKSQLTKEQKKSLRQELRQLRREEHTYIYILSPERL
jgi:hypothetical protein